MPRQRFRRENCSVARSLELVGEWWTMLIVREAYYGTRRFDDFQRNLGIATNILTARLRALVRNGLLQKGADPVDRRRFDYRLTEKGRDLFPATIALLQWGDRWLQTPETIPLKVVDKSDGAPIAPVVVRSAAGKELTVRDITWQPGPGATPAQRLRHSSADGAKAEGAAPRAVQRKRSSPARLRS
jgi:DNA-binding HxlR family transcriptional regulator